MAQPITIQVQGTDGVPAERLVDAVVKLLGVLRDLDARNNEDGKPGIQWRVTRASTNSPLTLTMTPHVGPKRDDNSRIVVRSYLRGMRKLEEGRGVPKDFGEETLREARALIGLLDRGISRMEFSSPGEDSVVPTLRSAAVIDEHLGQRAAYHMAETTVEGTLETVTVHGGEAFDVFDQLTGTRVRCTIAAEQLSTAIDALRKRVAVSGRARFNEKGRPISIEVESIRVLRGREAIPKASDFEGDGRLDITGGMESSEFVRRLRDA